MSISRSVQFRGIEATLKAFSWRKVDCWAIWQNNQFMLRYPANKGDKRTHEEAAAVLADALELLDNNGSPAVYTLKVYDELPKGALLKSNTPDDGSFNFQLNENETRALARSGGDAGSADVKLLIAEMRGLNERIKLIEEDTGGDGEEEEEDLFDKVGRIMEKPAVQNFIQMFMQGIGVNAPAVGSRAINGVPGVNEEEQQLPGQLVLTEKMGAALITLIKCDPEFENHIEKIAALAKSEPGKYKMFASML